MILRTTKVSVASGSKKPSTLLVCCILLALVVLASSFNPSTAASRKHRRRYPSSLTYYIHAILDISTVYITQPVNVVATGTFGQASIFDYKATLQPDRNSTQVGSIRGLEIYNSLDPANPSILILNTLTYDDGVYAGTVSLHGQANINLTDYDITVVGGTADFVGVRGYAAITNLRTPGADHVFRHVLHFSWLISTSSTR